MTGMSYNRTQNGRWHYILFALAAAMLGGAWLSGRAPAVVGLCLFTAAVFAACGLMFGSLTVRDEGQWLALRFGPLPVARKQIRYDAITAVDAGRSSLLDGWGIHFMPGRGWTYNIWGFACVKVTLGRNVIRIGSDDAENLANFLREKARLDGPAG